jgi:hypothetical protein
MREENCFWKACIKDWQNVMWLKYIFIMIIMIIIVIIKSWSIRTVDKY